MHNYEIVENYILEHYQQIGNQDYFFSSKKISRHLHLSSSTIGAYLSDLREAGMIQHYNRNIWKTCINKKEPTKKPFWKVFFN